MLMLMRWCGHIVRSTSGTDSVMSIAIPGVRGRGRPKKSWSECVKANVNVCNLGGIDPQHREAWRSGVRHSSHLLPTPVPGTLAAAVDK